MIVYELDTNSYQARRVFSVNQLPGEPRGMLMRSRIEIAPCELILIGGTSGVHRMKVPWVKEGAVGREHWEKAVEAFMEAGIGGMAMAIYHRESHWKGRLINIAAGDADINFPIIKVAPERVFYDSPGEALMDRLFFQKRMNVKIHPLIKDIVTEGHVMDLLDGLEYESFRAMHVDAALLNKEWKAVWVGELHDEYYHKKDPRTIRNDELKQKIFKMCSFEVEVFESDDIIETVNRVSEKYKGLRRDIDEIDG